MKKWFICLITVSVILIPLELRASMRNDIPSCYEYAGLLNKLSNSPQNELFVIIDQTVVLDETLKQLINENVQSFLRHDLKVNILTFSAFAKGQYTKLIFSGYFEPKLPQRERNRTGRIQLKNFDNCLINQIKAMEVIHQQIGLSLNYGTQSFPKTELIGTLLDISTSIISQSNANKKTVLVVSDMLENSDSLTFYSKGRVSLKEIDSAISILNKTEFQGDFDNANVFVVGAGFALGIQNYISQSELNQLEEFWRQVITKHNGVLKGFGKPNLLVPLH